MGVCDAHSNEIVQNYIYCLVTYSVDSVTGVDGMIMTKQLVKIVQIMHTVKSEWVRIPIATLRIGFHGLSK